MGMSLNGMKLITKAPHPDIVQTHPIPLVGHTDIVKSQICCPLHSGAVKRNLLLQSLKFQGVVFFFMLYLHNHAGMIRHYISYLDNEIENAN